MKRMRMMAILLAVCLLLSLFSVVTAAEDAEENAAVAAAETAEEAASGEAGAAAETETAEAAETAETVTVEETEDADTAEEAAAVLLEEVPALTLGEPLLLTSVCGDLENGNSFTFTPPESGNYRFHTELSEGNDGACAVFFSTDDGVLYNYAGLEFSGSGFMGNGVLAAELEAGKTYLLFTYLNDIYEGRTYASPVEYTVVAEKMAPVTGLSLSLSEWMPSLYVGDGTMGGSWSADGTYYAFDSVAVGIRINVTVELGDGTAESLSASGVTGLSYDCSSWTVGGENPVTVTVGDCSEVINVPLLPAVTELSVTLADPKASLILGNTAEGSWSSYRDEETGETVKYFGFYQDAIGRLLRIEAAFADGTEKELSGSDRDLSFSYDCRSWTPGGDGNLVTVTLGGVSRTVSIPMAEEADLYESAAPLTEEAPCEVHYDGTAASGALIFTPERDGEYAFWSEGSYDTWIELWDADGNSLGSNDDGGSGNNFRLACTLEAGETYLLLTRNYSVSSSADYTVYAQREKAVTALTVTLADPEAALVSGDDALGWWDTYYDAEREEDIRYFFFQDSAVGGLLRIEAVFDDGSEEELGWNDGRVSLIYESAEWTVGGDNPVTVEVGDISGTVSVPVESTVSGYAAAAALAPGEACEVSYDGTALSGARSFTPARDGHYEIRAETEVCVQLSVFAADGYLLGSASVWGGDTYRIPCVLKAGETCYVVTRPYNEETETAEYTLYTERVKEVTAISVTLREDAEPLTVGSSAGRWSYWYDNSGPESVRVDYYDFYSDAIGPLLDIHVVYDDDSTTDLDYMADGVSLSYDCRSWTEGGAENLVTVTAGEVSAGICVPVRSYLSQYADSPVLTVGTPVSVSYDGTLPSGALLFTPGESGTYTFASRGDADTYLTLYDASGRNLASDDDSGEGSNFFLARYLTGGETYLLGTRRYSQNESGEYTVLAEKRPAMTALTLALRSEDACLVAGVDGVASSYYDGEAWIPYCEFDASMVFDILTLTATYEDGTTAEITYNSPLDPVTCTYDCRTWSIGGADNLVTVRAGDAGEIEASISVPVASFASRYPDAPALTPEEPRIVSYTAYDEASGALTFTPEEDGVYYFYSSAVSMDTYTITADTVATLFDEWGRGLAKNDDAGVASFDFLLEASLTAGTPCLLRTNTYSGSDGLYQVTVSRTRPQLEELGYEDLAGMDLSGKMINVVFIVDTTGSMGGEINSVRNTLSRFASALADTHALLRIALINYQDITCDGMDSTVLHYSDELSLWFDNDDMDKLLAEIGSLYADDGGDTPETAVDALGYLTDPDYLTFNSQAARFAFVITDAGTKLNNRHGIGSMEELIRRLQVKGVAVSVVTGKDCFPEYRALTDGTGGILINLDGDFENAMASFAASVAAATADYTSDDTVIPVTDISLGEDLTVPEGRLRSFSVTVTPANATDRGVVWQVEDETVAAVTEDTTSSLLVIQGKQAGETRIVARSRDGGYVAWFTLTVQPVVVTTDSETSAVTVETCDLDALVTIAKGEDESVTDADTLIYYADDTEETAIDSGVQTELYSAIQDTGRSLSFSYSDSTGELNYQWTFTGSELNDPSRTVSDMAIEVGSGESPAKEALEASELSETETFDFAHHGELPGTAVIRAAVELPDGVYSLFWLNEAGSLEPVTDLLGNPLKATVADGIAEFSITHCSTYVIGMSVSGSISGFYRGESVLEDIPEEVFDVTVRVSAGDGKTVVYLSAYDAAGRMLFLDAQPAESNAADAAVTFAGLDNRDGSIARLKAFVVATAGEFRPIGEAKALGAD